MKLTWALGMCLLLKDGGLASELHMWETVPSVIRADGIETCNLEVRPLKGVAAVELVRLDVRLIGPGDLRLKDDGVSPDRVSGDGVYTVGPFRYNLAIERDLPFPAFYENNQDSPPGLFTQDLGHLQMTKADGGTVIFFISPTIGFLNPSIPIAPRQALSAKIRTGSHLIEVRDARADTQASLRLRESNALQSLMRDVYAAIPDFFDFGVVSATSHY